MSSNAHALCSAPPVESKRISRRAMLKGVGAGAVTTVAVGVPGFGGVAFASNNSNRVGDVVVNVFLRGGMDGLSVVGPRHDGAGASELLAARPTIALDPATLLALDDDFGLHPAMASLMPLWSADRLALIPAAGFPNGDRSHFAVQRKMDEGLDNGVVGSGWLARHLDVTASPPPGGLRAATMPFGQRSMAGSSVSVTMGSVDSFRVNGFRGNGGAIRAAMQDLHAVDESRVVNQRSREALAALDIVNDAPIIGPADGVVYPTSGRGRNFGRVMAEVAQLIRADVGIEAVATEASLGWDLHQGFGDATSGRQAENLGALADVLAAFAQDLGDHFQKVTVVLMTEFGRTFRENGGAGVDHGRASTMMVLGGGIRGGLYGDWPGLGSTDIDGNALRVTVDYRSVLADILQYRLATGDLSAVLPGYADTPEKRLGFALPLAVTP
jgi:uncharacterized protein (DUF1501 family)